MYVVLYVIKTHMTHRNVGTKTNKTRRAEISRGVIFHITEGIITPRPKDFNQHRYFQPRGHARNSDFYSFNYVYGAPQYYAPPSPIYEQYPQPYYNNTETQGYTRNYRGRGRGNYYNNARKPLMEENEESGKGYDNNRDTKHRGQLRRGTYNNKHNGYKQQRSHYP